ncbi:AAA family ATPase [Streptomycetaceae bacterium NBC_01309]
MTAPKSDDPAGTRGTPNNWRVFHGTDVPGRPAEIPPPPPWRTFDGGPLMAPPVDDSFELARRRLGVPALRTDHRAAPFGDEQTDVVNAALLLRRPLLVTGIPGTGKSSLAYRIARELGLGRVLTWSVTSRSTLRDGLYSYDAIGRVHDAGLRQPGPDSAETSIGDYIHLGPLGTALLPYERPRVLLVDELDKSDIDLPNDLLHVFEDGEFEIPELVRARGQSAQVEVLTDDPGGTAPISEGRVRCREFPVVVISSNGEQEFPPAFRRRCLRLDLQPPGPEQLAAMVAAHFGDDVADRARDVVEAFVLRSRDSGGLATDQLLNAVHLMTSGGVTPRGPRWDELMAAVWRRLGDD